MNAQRFAAVVATIALIAGALAIRRMIDDDESSADSSATTTEPGGAPAGQMVCITELEVVCKELAAEFPGLTAITEPALDTVDRLATVEAAEAPIWITVEPFPAMVDVLRTNAGDEGLGWANEPVGATQLAIAVRNGRLRALEAACAGRTTWRCIGDAESFADLGGDGAVSVGFGDADHSAEALAGVAAATAGYFDRTDVVQSDFDAEPGFRVWFRELVTSSSLTSLSGGSPLATMLTRPAVTVASTYDAQFASLPAAAAERAELHYPRPAMWLQAVVATPSSLAAPDRLVERASTTLEGAGWEPTAAADAALLRPATMLALRTLWQEAA